MAEVVKRVGVRKESGYLYYLGKDGMYGVPRWPVRVKVEAMQKKYPMPVFLGSQVTSTILIRMAMFPDLQWPEAANTRVIKTIKKPSVSEGFFFCCCSGTS